MCVGESLRESNKLPEKNSIVHKNPTQCVCLSGGGGGGAPVPFLGGFRHSSLHVMQYSVFNLLLFLQKNQGKMYECNTPALAFVAGG